jgi:hypothetical protein
MTDQTSMSKRVMPVLLAAAVAILVPGGATAKTDAHPDLWATVNLCDAPSKPGGIGVRVSIPSEQGVPQQWARIRLQWFDGNARAWRAVRSGGDAGWARIGVGRRLVEGGTTFSFPPPAAGARMVLRGVVEIQWRDGKDVVDHARMLTTEGHATAGDRHRRVSRSSCEIKR